MQNEMMKILIMHSSQHNNYLQSAVHLLIAVHASMNPLDALLVVNNCVIINPCHPACVVRPEFIHIELDKHRFIYCRGYELNKEKNRK